MYRYPAPSIIETPRIVSTLSYSEHLSPTYGAYTLSRRFAILHSYGLSILHFPFGTTLHTVCLHSLTSPFWYEQ